MKKLFAVLVVLLIIATPVFAFRASDYVTANGITKAQQMIEQLISNKTLPQNAANILSSFRLTMSNSLSSDEMKTISFKGIVDSVSVTIHGNGTKLGAFNTTEFVADNQSVTPLNFKYYPRNITLTFKGFEWWNSNNQHIVNNTGAVIGSAINETDGSWSVTDDYTSVNPIWQSKDANLTVNTSSGWLEASDSVAGTFDVIYNISIDDGTFVTATLDNESFYVAPNATAAATQDDLNIYISNDSGSTWTLIMDGADGSTSTGTQYTGTIDLSTYVSGKSSFLIKIEFISDGADDDTSQADVHFNALSISGTVSKLPTRSPKIDLNDDGIWDYSSAATLTNGTSVSFQLNDSDLSLSNNIKVYAGGSEKVIVNFTWYDDGRVHINRVIFGDDNKTVDAFIAAGENVTVQFVNMTKLFAPLTFAIDVDTEHTLNSSYNYTITVDRLGFMLMDHATLSISPVDGAFVQAYKSISKPIPVFVKPRNAEVAVSVNLYNENASAGETYLNMTMASVHNNTADVVITDIPDTVPQLDLYIDGNYVKTLTVNNSTVYFSIDKFSTHDVSLIVSGAILAAPEEIDWQWIAAFIIVVTMFTVLGYLAIATLRGR